MLDVLQIVLDPALHLVQRVGLAAQTVDLCPAGDARLDLVAAEIAVDHRRVLLVEGNRVRSRPDDRHLAAEHIDELRQLVKRQPAQDAPHPGHPRVVGRHLPKRGRWGRARLDSQRAELEERENLLIATMARLAIDHRPRAVQLDEQGDQQKGRREHDQGHGGNRQVDRPLEQNAPPLGPL